MTRNKLQEKNRALTRSVALPVEHGAWGFLFEPLLAGLLLFPSLVSLSVAVFVVGGFLVRQPLKFLLGDFFQKRRLPRTSIAFKFVIYSLFVALFGFLGILALGGPNVLIPFLIITPVVIFLIREDVSRRARELAPELLAAFALSSSIAAMAVGAGASPQTAAAFWALLLARLIPSILYVRARLRLEKRKPTHQLPPDLAHIAALVVIAGLYMYGFASVLTLGLAALLALRSFTGLSTFRKKLTAREIGIREVVLGVLYAASVVIGYYLGI